MNLTARSLTTTPARIGNEPRQLAPVAVPTGRRHFKLANPAFVGPARPLRVVRANGAQDNSYLETQKKTNNDVNSVREEVKATLERLMSGLQGAQAGGDGAGGGAAAAGGGAAGRAAEVERLRTKLRHAVGAMQEGLVERDAEVRLLLLAAMAGEHILLIGPPGTAKSEVGRRLNTLIDGTYFERLLTRFSVPEELFGPLSMRALEEDRYVRQVDGYLPTAEVAFIDEIFKANSAILNTLLTLINERLFDNGNLRVPVPLISMVGASNELPESEELDALYDRFLIRRQVRQVTPAGVAQMLSYYSSAAAVTAATPPSNDGRSSSPSSSPSSPSSSFSERTRAAVSADLRLTRGDIVRCKAAAVAAVRVPPGVIQLVTDLRSYLQEKIEPPVYVSDRRLVKSIQLLQVAAYCNGRDSVSEFDCLLLQHVLWQRPEQADRIHDWIIGQLSVDDGAKQVQYLLQGLFSRACRSLGNMEKVAAIQTEVQELVKVLADKYQHVASSLSGGFPVVLDNLWLGTDESEAVATALQPRLVKTRAAVEQVLLDVVTLDAALRRGADPVTLANLMPRYWADFIRNSDITEVKPLGTTPLAGAARRI
ncbi:hypothetical protein Agub_g13786 [Astrephomene gubernaculifera]|uniref:AAA+ ATPase domain-containing protein n=1 Tax=Astrephomene gubernaculifera TaxID=47775 RepID=A0AAD3E1X7_9CHLO|nr:hypothetical protein Agub_g13786 [Astrephomene gubernaculifera]